MMVDTTDFIVILPFAVLLIGAALTYFLGKFGKVTRQTETSGPVSVVFFLITLILLLKMFFDNGTEILDKELFGTVAMAATGTALLISIVAVVMGLLVAIYSIGYMEGKPRTNKFFALLMLMVAGIIGIGFSNDLFNLYVAFEVMSIASFALVAFERDRWEPVEAGTKYIIMSGAGSALALVGISLVYATTGATDLDAVKNALAAGDDVQGPVASLALMLMIVGFGVKTAMVPLHTWLPDAHSAAPSGISAMLSGVVIQAGLLTLMKSSVPFLYDGPYGMGINVNAMPGIHVGLALAVLAVLTMTVGNLMALRQKDLKRMLAYSSVAQMGYILMGVGLWMYAPAVAEVGLWGGMLHIVTHAFMKGGAFLVAGAIIYSIGTRDLHEMRGIGRHNLVIGVCFAIFAFSLAGLPPLSGFVSEILIIRAGVDIAVLGVGIATWGLFFSAAIIINSVISLGYYLPAVNKIVFAKNMTPLAAKAKPLPYTITVPIVIMAALTLILGIFPDVGLHLVEPAVEAFQDFVGINPGTGGV